MIPSQKRNNMKQSKHEIICKIALILIILITPFRYAHKSSKTKQKYDDLTTQYNELYDNIKATTSKIKELQVETEKLEAEISVMEVQLEKKMHIK